MSLNEICQSSREFASIHGWIFSKLKL